MYRGLLVLIAYFACCVPVQSGNSNSLPSLSESSQLIVDGKHFLILGGELGNSTASDLESIKAHWPTFTTLNINTVLAPVYWDLRRPYAFCE